MAQIRTIGRSFNGGELTPEYFGRVDDVKYGAGLAVCRNFIPLPHGPAVNRPGTEYVAAVKHSSKRTRILPFSYSTTQTMVIEMGDGYFRFHTLAATLLCGAPAAYDNSAAYGVGALVSVGLAVYYCVTPTTGHAPPNITYWYALPSAAYEIPSPYLEADLFDVHYVQSNDVLTLTHPNHPPCELRRYGATDWRLQVIAFATPLLPPTGLSCAATVPGGATNLQDYKYVVTSVDATGLEESLASSSVTTNVSNNLLATGAYNIVTWSVATAAIYYNVYKESNGLYGFIGQTPDASFKDDNITADLSKTPPQNLNPFTASGDYPAAVSYFEQRRCFAGTRNKGQSIWMTRAGTESNLNYSLPSRDDDSISFRVAAREANTIRHLVPLTNLIALTSSAEWRITAIDTNALTPTSISVRPQSYVGANDCQPVIVNNNLIYAAARGGHLRELAYNADAAGYLTGDLSLRAPHLFDGFDVADLAYAKAPVPVIWAVSTSGKLLGLTYVPEQQVGAWHWHDTKSGSFESVCVVSEGDEEAVYVVVKRRINSADVRYVERMRSRLITSNDALADCFFVDCGTTYGDEVPETPTAAITGLTWLEGETVSILADGAVHPQRVITGGTIHLDRPAAKVQIGLPIIAELQTLPVVIDVPGLGQGRPKNVNCVWLRVYRSSGIFAGPDADHLTEAKQRTTESWGTPPRLKTDEIEIVIPPNWTNAGQVFIRQSDPLPLTVVSLTLEVEVGG